MLKRQPLLLTYMVPGTGHQRAAQAIIQAFKKLDPHQPCQELAGLNFTSPFLGNIFNQMYLQVLKRTPFIWNYLYDNPNVEELTRDARGLLTFMTKFPTKKILRKYRPRGVVCTQAIAANIFSAAKKGGLFRGPLIGCITDFGVHSYWFHPEIDMYLVPHQEIQTELHRRGKIPLNKIYITGIPVDPTYGDSISMAAARKKLNLPPRLKTILLMGGHYGIGNLEDIVDGLLELPRNFQVLVVCGKNKRLLERIQKKTRSQAHFKTWGYSTEIAQLMAASDLIVTKPGGLTTSEALARQRPLILINPLPGQEEKNARFLIRHQAARVCYSAHEVKSLVWKLLRGKKNLQKMEIKTQKLSRPHSAWDAARHISDLIHHRNLPPTPSSNLRTHKK